MDKTAVARHIKNEWGRFSALIRRNKTKIGASEISAVLTDDGYEAFGRSSLDGILADKGGLRFRCGRYPSEVCLHRDYGFYVPDGNPVGGKYFRIDEVDKRIDEILAAGYRPPRRHYRRPASVEAAIEDIRGRFKEARELVDGRGPGSLGDMLYRNGYFVSYDGFSVCNFSKGFLHFSARCDGRWKLEDRYVAFVDGDDSLSEEFCLEGHGELNLEDDFEAIFTDEFRFGRRVTEKERIGQYSRFRVRSYVPKELSTLKWFDSFEEAKAFALETAKRYAESVKDDRRRYAFTNPLDVSDRYDYLCAYVWYRYNRGSEHMVFVQGED